MWDVNAKAERVTQVDTSGAYVPQGNKVSMAYPADGAVATVTIAAVATKRHRLSYLHIVGYNTAARTGAAAPVAVTITGLDNANLTLPAPTAGAIGTTFEFKMEGMRPLEGLVNTALVVSCPSTTGIRWSVIVGYTTGD